MKRIFFLIFLSFTVNSFAFDLESVDSEKWTKKYDQYFSKYTKRFFGVGFDWRWFKAQAIAESNINSNAKSWVGAKGVMQIMPETFEEIKKKNPSFLNINEPRWNIAAGIYYDSVLYEKWHSDRPLSDKMSYTFGSYNAGFANILRAQNVAKKEGHDERYWKSIKEIAPKVKRWRHEETLNYVEKIKFMMKDEAKNSDKKKD